MEDRLEEYIKALQALLPVIQNDSCMSCLCQALNTKVAEALYANMITKETAMRMDNVLQSLCSTSVGKASSPEDGSSTAEPDWKREAEQAAKGWSPGRWSKFAAHIDLSLIHI